MTRSLAAASGASRYPYQLKIWLLGGRCCAPVPAGGIRRQAVERPDGSYGDIVQFARLASDQTNGPHGFLG